MTVAGFEKMKIAERAARVNGPLMRLLNERWPNPDEDDSDYQCMLCRVQTITQAVVDLIAEGLL
jgi:hypothetical protein